MIEEAYIYPRVGGQMTPEEILQTLTHMANRPSSSVSRPAVISLQDGTTLTARITGFNLQMPGNLTINTLDSSNTNRQIHGDEIISIQP